MIVLLSPSKNLHNIPQPSHRHSLPRMPEESQQLIESLKKLKPARLAELMDINDKLAQLNHSRYHSYSWPHTPENGTAAIYTFRGEVYLGFEAGTMTKVQAEQADKYVRILSGLYGVLRPLDLIQPYRLEMSTELKTGKAKNLYQFWGSKITNLLNEDVANTKSKEIINLASQEYMAAIQVDKLSVPVTDISFLEDRNGKLQFLSYNAKRSRGWMARYIVDNKISKSSALKGFDLQGYSYREELSDEKKMVFVR
jgi:cytoplasmic iron level regulating protein YaaA (DUF328/UPF0246 family)